MPQLPGGKPSWAFQTEWASILRECSQKLMEATANYLATERVSELGQKADTLASSSQTKLEMALPVEDLVKGLKLFDIVNKSMKRLRQVKLGKISKPKSKKAIKLRVRHQKKAVVRKLLL